MNRQQITQLLGISFTDSQVQRVIAELGMPTTKDFDYTFVQVKQIIKFCKDSLPLPTPAPGFNFSLPSGKSFPI